MNRILALMLVSGVLGTLTACDGEPDATAPERVRSIKPYYVSEPAGGEVRRLSGTIAAAAAPISDQRSPAAPSAPTPSGPREREVALPAVAASR